MIKYRITVTGKMVPAIMLVIAILSFGLLIPFLGFYWDDWAKILVARLWGVQAYFGYYAEDRPLSAWTHMLFTPLLGQTPFPWHVFTLLLRWASALTMWYLLGSIWPRARRQNLVAALLFLIYPVFVSQPVAVTFHQQWLQFFLYFLSLLFMVRAARAQPGTQEYRRHFWWLTGLSILTMALQLSVTEYFVPLELVRPVILWILFTNQELTPAGEPEQAVLKGTSSRFLPRLLRAWGPYLAALVGYVIWRLFFIHLPGSDPYRATTLYGLVSRPIDTLRSLLPVIIVDLWHILYQSWATLTSVQITGLKPFTVASYGVSLLAGILAAFIIMFFREDQGNTHEGYLETDRRWLKQAVILGTVALLLGPVPAWITGRQVVFDFHSDRFAMPAMFGGGILIAVLIEWLAQRWLQRAILTGLLVFLAVNMHLKVANDYRWIWTDEQRFFWQLSWRAPGLKAPTAIFSEKELFANQGLFSTSAALNLVYPQPQGWGAPVNSSDLPEKSTLAGNQTGHLAYWMYTISPRYTHAPDSYDFQLSTTFRTLQFRGQTPDSLVVYENPAFGNCLWVLSQHDIHNPYISDLVGAFLPISNLDRILPTAQQPGYPPADILGPEPSNTWCYYFERADLARQYQQWDQVSKLYDGAVAQGYHLGKPGSDSGYEWLPFIQGLGSTGRWDDAASLTNQINEHEPIYREMLCQIWQDDLAAFHNDPAVQPVFQQVEINLGCRD